MATESVVLDKRFQMGKVLGRGPSGVVHLATDLSRGGECVVKRIYPKYGNRNILDRVQAMSHAAADMMHPAVLGVLYTGFEQAGTLYLVSPLAQGESLRTKLLRGPLSLTATLAILEPLCSALQSAAEKNLAHGALHPNNIWIAPDGGVVLTDFGMAVLRGSAGVKWDGTLGYVAPETLETGAETATVRADVFALGALVYECLIGQPMFEAKSLASYLAMVGTPPKMTVKHPSYAHLDAVLEMAAAADPEARFATVHALWRALQSALLDLPASLANNLTRGMAPSAQRAVSPSKPPLVGKGNSTPPAPPQPKRSNPPAPPAASGSNPPGAPRNVQAMPALQIEEEIDAPEPLDPSGAFSAPGPPKPAQTAAKGSPAPTTPKLPEPLPPPPLATRPAAPAGTPAVTAPMAVVAVAPAITAPMPVAAAKPAQPAKPVASAPQASSAKAAHRPVVALTPIRPAPGKVDVAAPAEVRAPGPPRGPRLDPQQILPTDPSYRLRPPPPSRWAALAPLFWATIGGVVVGGSMIGVQYFSRVSQHPVAVQATSSTDVDALLRQAETEALQRNYASSFAYTDLVLRSHPAHPSAKIIAEQAGEQLRISAVYGAFLRAADREQSDVAVALYRELPPGSSFRTQAWDPFMAVRNSYVRRRLAVATAALSASECEGIREQIEKLYFVSDSATDSALQQGQRLLGKCKGGRTAEPAIAEKTDKPEKSEKSEKPDKPEKLEKADKPSKAEKSAKPDLVATNESGESAKPKRRKAKDKPTPDKPSDGPEKPKEPPKETLPSALRNPF